MFSNAVEIVILSWALLGSSTPGTASAEASSMAVDRPATAIEKAPDDAVAETCGKVAGRLASVRLSDCLEAGLRTTAVRSVNGVTLLEREYPPLAKREPLGKVLLFGGIHGDELSSVSIVFTWMEVLNRFHSGLFHWKIVPVLNPDGLLRRPAQRMNAHGVDLNRNFPCPDWQEATNDYWVRRTGKNPRRYPGPDALSEPESQWLAEQIEQFDPDVIVSVHAPHSVVDYDGPLDPPEKLGSLYLKLLGTYPGSLGRFGVHRDIPVVTIELSSAFSMPSAREQRQIWIDLVRWLRSNLPVTPDDGDAGGLVAAGGPSE